MFPQGQSPVIGSTNPLDGRTGASKRLARAGRAAAVLTLAAAVAMGGAGRASLAHAAPPAAPPQGAPLQPPTRFDPTVEVSPFPRSPRSAGTAFSISRSGVWLSAAHVLEGCLQAAVIVSPGRGALATVRLDPDSDVAVLTTVGGAPALPLGLDLPLHMGAPGFHPGFPQGRPGEVATRALGRESLLVRRPGPGGVHAEPVVAWAEVERTPGLAGGLEGLSGAPVLDAGGRVVGLTLAEAPQRGRIYTVAPETLAAALGRAGVRIQPVAALPLTSESFGRTANQLRHDLSVAQVRCLKR